jgi:hypothetical protein
MKTMNWALSIILGLFSVNAHAVGRYTADADSGVTRIDIGFMRNDRTSNYSGQSAVDTQINHLNTKVGYVFTNGFYLGGLYEYSTFEFQTTNASTDNRTGYGASLGYFNSGFYVMGTYFVSSTYTFSGGDTFTGSSSYLAEVGYNYNVAGNFNVGLGIVYASYSWNQHTSGGTTISQTNTQTDTYPCVNLGFSF